jgi:hypothetical protein
VDLGLRVGYKHHAVPNYAISAKNLGFENIGAVIGGATQVEGIGLAFPADRWDHGAP